MMGSKSARPRPPASLQKAGQGLWAAILDDLEDDWQLDAREEHLLARACSCADDIAALEAAVTADGVTTTGSRGQVVVHPALSEIRQLRLVQLRLLGALELSDPAATKSGTLASQRARRAAEARWAGHGGARAHG